MKRTITIILAVLLLSVTVYALPGVYEVPAPNDYPVDCWGVWQVPCIGTRSPLYEGKGIGQDVIDADNSALIRKIGKGYGIFDHAGSEITGHFWNVEEIKPGSGGFLCREGKPEVCYECTAVYLTQQVGNSYYYHGKTIVPGTGIICVSCADEDGWCYVAVFEKVGVMP